MLTIISNTNLIHGLAQLDYILFGKM